MTNAYIRTFSAIHQDDIDAVGGKGANLGELTGRGFPVPPGFVVTAQAYTDFFTALPLKEELRQLEKARPDAFERHCAVIREAITTTDLSAEPVEAILTAHKRLVGNRAADTVCVVRSSATTEDLRDASFAGQHGTYYYVDRENLTRMVRQCWASLWNTEAVSYRAARGIDHSAARMAVAVQEMIRAQVSGITFTVNPVSGAQEIVTESSWGMGAAIVDGRVTPDRYILERGSLRLRERRIARKQFMVAADLRAGAESRLKEVSPDIRLRETLTPDLLKIVATWAVKAEEHFGCPQDLEWAIADRQFHLLQSRPITAIGTGGGDRAKDPAGRYVLFKPFAENLSEPLTPIMMQLLSPIISPMIRFIDGRPYSDLKYLRPVIPFKISEQELAELLYGLSIDIHPPLTRIAWLKLPFFFMALLYGYLTCGTTFARTRDMPDDFMDRYRTLCREVEDDPARGPVDTLRRLWLVPNFFDPIGNTPMSVNFSAARAMLFLGPLQMLIRHWLPDAPPDTMTRLCSGQEGVLSADMGHEIRVLAKEADRCPAVRELLLHCPAEQVPAKIREEPEADTFLRLFDLFLEEHGHRALKELEPRSPRWEENPAQVFGMIRNYLLTDTDRIAPEQQSSQRSQSRAELENDLRRQLERLPFERLFRPRWRLLKALFVQAGYLFKLRENSRFYHIMGLYVVRKKLLRIERDLLAQGKLKCKDDIFFLHPGEVSRMRRGRLDWQDIEERLRQRRLEYIRFSGKPPRKTVGIALADNPLPPEHRSEDSTVLPGQSASPGCYEGIARVILDPSVDAELRPGEILVAPYTDPAWTPLFLTAGAAVVEVGSYLSHTGTVAREYGLPCVVDVAGCAKRIQTGDRLYVDGDQGVVRIIADHRPNEEKIQEEAT